MGNVENQGGFVVDGEVALGESGWSVSHAGDVNRDGLADVIIGAPTAGRSYVVFGKVDDDAVALSAVRSGRGGFALEGEAAQDRSGTSVAGAGDINGDGFADLIVGAERSGASPDGGGFGRSYVVFGRSETDAVALSAVAMGVGGFAVDREAAGDRFGSDVSGAGDVNGDGLDDVIVAARRADRNGDGSPRSYVVFGKTDSAPVQLGAVASGVGGFALDGEAYVHEVSGAGDVNGDGLDDVIVGAPLASPSGDSSGRTYVVFGKADTSPVQLSTLAMGIGGFAVDGENADDHSGGSVSGAGDVNGDGFADVIIGATGYLGGRSYVVFGKANTDSVRLSEVGLGSRGFVLNGETAGDSAVRSVVSGAGDVNDDGLDDVIVGVPEAGEIGSSRGQTYIVFGKSDGKAVELSAVAAGVGGFALAGEMEDDYAGWSVSGAGDVNGDGLADVITGAQGFPNGDDYGRSYVVFGGSLGPA